MGGVEGANCGQGVMYERRINTKKRKKIDNIPTKLSQYFFTHFQSFRSELTSIPTYEHILLLKEL